MRQLGSAIRINFSDCERSGPTGLELFGENLNQEFESMIDHNIEDSAVSYLGMYHEARFSLRPLQFLFETSIRDSLDHRVRMVKESKDAE
ncbi:hypothetical protein Tco_1352651 [Tanacetum coccineum]